jgi:hypothetical protein
MSKIIMGDLHGCLAELKELLKLIPCRPSVDHLIFLGDLMDRGPDSAGAIRFVRELSEKYNAVSLMGNHDEKYVRYYAHLQKPKGKGSSAMVFGEAKQAVFHQLAPEDHQWLGRRPLYDRGDGFLAVHAGVCPRRHRSWADLDKRKFQVRLYRLRNVDAQGRMLDRQDKRRPDDPAPDPFAQPWWRMYDGRFGHVFYGHQPSGSVVEGPHSSGLDTSCCFGGHLTACVFEDPRERSYHSVKAHAPYAERDDRGEDD